MKDRIACVGKFLRTLKAGDIIGFSGTRWWNFGINVFTYGMPFWGLSHVAIVADVKDFRNPVKAGPDLLEYGLLLFESTMSYHKPCAIQRKLVKGVQAHEPLDRILNATGKVWHYPLAKALRPLKSATLTAFLLRYLGTNYDAIGAFRAAGIGFSWIESLLRQEDLSSVYCSELCAAAHKRIGVFDTRNASRWSPNNFVRTEQRMGILLKPKRVP